MMRRLVAAGLLLWPLQAAAVELRQIKVVTGSTGLIHVPVEVANASGEAMSCTLQLAHWYSINLGTTAPGDNALIDLWFDTSSATYLVLNDSQENMPVEAAWCGLAGRAYETRSEIALRRHAGNNPVASKISCTAPGGRLSCK